MAAKIYTLPEIIAFEWDTANVHKNQLKHDVEPSECEEVFYNPLIISADSAHSTAEPRLHALGRTHTHRLLFIVFTVRKGKLRIISARDQSKKERVIYKEVPRNV